MVEQKSLGEELNHKTQGFIRNLIVTPREGADSMYKFQIRFIDGQDNLQEPEDWYSGFKEPPAREGDYIIFTYKIVDKGDKVYYNVKDVLDVKLTHDDVDESDVEKLEDVTKNMVEPEIQSDLEGESATIPTPEVIDREDLDKSYKALLLNGTIHLCTRRGTLTDAEIITQYNRFLKLIE